MQRIVIFGGTFNPIHNGHIHLAKQFAQMLNAEKVLLIPAHVPPHKQVKDLASAEDRLKMCRLASEDTLFEVSDIEIKRQGLSYTSDTLLELKQTYPDSELYFITGEDMFLTLENWHDVQAIYKLATLCAAPRSETGLQRLVDYAETLQRDGAKTVVKNIKYLPISSTMVRNAIKNGTSISGLVPPVIADYIIENNLYLEQENE